MTSPTRTLVRQPARLVLAAAALVAAAAHVPVTGPHLEEAPYMGVLFVLLTAACVLLAGAAVVTSHPVVPALSAAVCGAAIVGYAATRLVAFPMLSDDVGNWLEPLGVLSVASELAVVASALRLLVAHRRAAGATPAGPAGPAVPGR